jgi:tetratricopeptide (TPR) repeat protein
LNGAMIPERYFAWLRTGQGEWLRDVLHHNRQDVVSLAQLLHTIAGVLLPARRLEPGEAADRVHPGDIAGLGRAYARRNRHEDALACFEAALERLWAPWMERELQDRVAIDRARVLTRLGRLDEAASAWEAVAMDGGPGAALAWVQVAKMREHALKDPGAALQAALRAEALAARRRLLGNPDRVVERDLLGRLSRLRRLCPRRPVSDAPEQAPPPATAGGYHATAVDVGRVARITNGGPTMDCVTEDPALQHGPGPSDGTCAR